jgi:hypothetical protein
VFWRLCERGWLCFRFACCYACLATQQAYSMRYNRGAALACGVCEAVGPWVGVSADFGRTAMTLDSLRLLSAVAARIFSSQLSLASANRGCWIAVAVPSLS